MKEDGDLWRFSCLRQRDFPDNSMEQRHCRVKRLVRPGLGFGGFHTARRKLAAYEAMAIIRNAWVRKLGRRGMRDRTIFVAHLFQVAA
jgi:transposase-like protein